MDGRPVELEDLLRFELTSNAQISPDGNKVVYSVKRIDPKKNKYFTRLWIANVASGKSCPFTSDRHTDSGAVWSPDGAQVAFVSNRDKPGDQIYLIPSTGGEAEPLTTLPEGSAEEIAWSPDGMKIAFLFRLSPITSSDESTKARKESGASFPVRRHSKLFYRLDGFGYFDGAYSQIWVVNVENGETNQLTHADHHISSLTWSPDSTNVTFASNRREDDDLEPGYEGIWTIPCDGGSISQVSAVDGPKSDLCYSPDGKYIAWVGHADPKESWGGLNYRIMYVGVSGGETVDVTGHTDKHVGYETLSDTHDVGGGRKLYWSIDGNSFYLPISENGDTRLYSISKDGSNLQCLTAADCELGSFSMASDGKSFAIQMSQWKKPSEIFCGKLNGTSPIDWQQLSVHNRWLDTEVSLQRPEEVKVTGSDGYEVHGWMLKPTNFDPSKQYPAIVYVHGGPAAQYGGLAAPFHELQWLAANGYVVVFGNPRGSRGYGEHHTGCIKGDWGNLDWIDVQAIADYAANQSYVDSSRMAIMGGSYGGFMTAWAVGQTNRFKCAIADRLVNNLPSFSGTVDFAWQHGGAWKGNAWNDIQDMWRCSPMAFAGNIETPLLLVHSDGDLRCPISQAEELFAALRFQRKTVELVRYPAESSHGLSRSGPPDLRIDRLRTNLEWLDRYLK